MRMQLDGPDLEELLVRARDEYGDHVHIIKADRVRSGGVGGFFSKERYELTVEADDYVDAAASTPDEPFSLLDLADLVSRRERLEGTTTVEQVLEPAPRTTPRMSTESDSFADVLAGLATAVEPAPAVPAPAGTTGGSTTVTVPDAPHTRPAFVPATAATVSTHRSITPNTLRELGVPAELMHASHDDDLLATLVSALRALPVAPPLPSRAGELLVVAGEAAVAWDAAYELAAAMELEERAITLVSRSQSVRVPASRRIENLDDLPLHIERWRRRTTPTVAVLDAPMSPRSSAWCSAALDQLAPAANTTWLAVPATRKTADIGEWSARIGHGDALIVTDVDASRDPASVLSLGLPVGWLDGRPASAGAWAGLLVQRLVEAA